MVDLPAPDIPVSQTMTGFCFLSAARSALAIESGCQWMLLARRNAKSIMPAPAVRLLARSIRMKLPVLWLSAKLSNAIGTEVDRLQTPISFRFSAVALMCSRVLTSIRYLRVVTVADTVEVPILR